MAKITGLNVVGRVAKFGNTELDKNGLYCISLTNLTENEV